VFRISCLGFRISPNPGLLLKITCRGVPSELALSEAKGLPTRHTGGFVNQPYCAFPSLATPALSLRAYMPICHCESRCNRDVAIPARASTVAMRRLLRCLPRLRLAASACNDMEACYCESRLYRDDCIGMTKQSHGKRGVILEEAPILSGRPKNLTVRQEHEILPLHFVQC